MYVAQDQGLTRVLAATMDMLATTMETMLQSPDPFHSMQVRATFGDFLFVWGSPSNIAKYMRVCVLAERSYSCHWVVFGYARLGVWADGQVRIRAPIVANTCCMPHKAFVCCNVFAASSR